MEFSSMYRCRKWMALICAGTLKALNRLPHIPVTLITAHRTSSRLKVEGLDAGAIDFISKPIDNNELVAKINVMHRIKRAEDELREINVNLEVMVAERTWKLQESEEKFKTLFEYAPDGYYLNDLRGNFIDDNRAAEKLTGYKKEELINKNFLKLELLPKNQIPKAAKNLAKNALGLPTGPDEFILNRKDGSQVPVEIRTFPVKIKNKTVVLGIARDITKHRKAEENL